MIDGNKLLDRTWLDRLVDRARFKLDIFPRLIYQPLPWLNLNKARRAAGVLSRWDAIQAALQERPSKPATAMDIGCQVGYFAISLAQQGVPVMAIEPDARQFRILQYAVRRLGLTDCIGTLQWTITPTTVNMLPQVDCVIFLSVWHHMVKTYGLEPATALLQTIWAKTQQVLFFETGEAEMPAEFGLPPMIVDGQRYLTELLTCTCAGAEVVHLGQHPAFDPAGHPVKRNLFVLIRQ
jgi:hypothetical protein